MKKHSKILLAVVCALMLVVGSVMGTLAYLTSVDSAVNTFTVGKVAITLDEAAVKQDGTFVTNHENRVKANTYHLLPGHEYHKDPTVTVLKDSEDVYVRMLVTVADLDDLKAALPATYVENNVFLLEKLVTGWDRNTWQVASVNGNVYEFRYKEIVPKNTAANTPLPELFTTISLPGAEITNTELASLAELQINVVAQAIQADGFNTADLAWAQFPTT